MKHVRTFSVLTALTTALLATTVHAQRGPAGWRPDPETIAPRWVEKFDADGSGELSVAELTEALTEMHARRDAMGGGMHKKMLRRDGSGPGPRTGLGPDASPKERAAFGIERFDDDGDGKLDAEEMAAMLEWRTTRGPNPKR